MDEHERVTEETPQQETHGRRDFLKKAGKVAIAAPALALILKAEKSHAWGRDMYGRGRSLDHRSYFQRDDRHRYRRHHRHHRGD